MAGTEACEAALLAFTGYTWSAVKPVAVCLLRASLSEFGRRAAGGEDVDVGPQRPLASGESVEDGVERLAGALDAFREAPFTIQRLCELLLSPRDYYTNMDKLVNAVEKLLTVTGMVSSLVSPPEWGGDAMDMDENPAAVRARNDPLNVAQTAFVSSLVAPAAGPSSAAAAAAAGGGGGSGAGSTATGAAAAEGQVGPSAAAGAAAGAGAGAAPMTEAGGDGGGRAVGDGVGVSEGSHIGGGGGGDGSNAGGSTTGGG